MKPLVLVTAPVGTRSGYGSHSRDIVRSLIAMDKFDIKIWPVRWGGTPQDALDEKNPYDIPIIDRLLTDPNLDRQPDVHFHIVVPNEFQSIGKYNIGITAGLETTVCPPEWIDGLNRMNLNIVPATFVKTSIESSVFDKHDQNTKQKIASIKCETPVEVLFEGADTEIYNETKEFSKDLVDTLKDVKEDFCFLFVGHWLQGGLGHDRKDLGMLIKTFLETFKNQKKQPALILKTSGATPSILDREEILSRIRQIRGTVKGKTPNIYVLHGDLEDEEMNGLYNHPKVKAHVSFTHGEGFGRPLLEASLSGKPVIAPNWGGQVDFLDANNSILLPGSLNKVKKESFPKNMYVDGSQWFTVNYNYASKILKDICDNYSKYIVKGKKLSIMNTTKFSLDAMTNKFEEILDKYLPEFEEQPTPVDLKLPKLKKVGEVTEKPKIELPKLKKVK
jgi:glycosyltransferase involved in cell wall biosynthesis|tara:strand:- start:243 stop:1583 length:1341 start_codon:yes stop_codon:yes gene_type:complete